MATDKERVTAYLDFPLYTKLERFQKARGFKTLSKAITTALDNYFEITEEQSAEAKKQTANELKREIGKMQSRLNELTEKVHKLSGENENSEE